MNTATLAARFHFTLPAAVLAVLQRALADPVTDRSLEKNATTWIARPLTRSWPAASSCLHACQSPCSWSMVPGWSRSSAH